MRITKRQLRRIIREAIGERTKPYGKLYGLDYHEVGETAEMLEMSFEEYAEAYDEAASRHNVRITKRTPELITVVGEKNNLINFAAQIWDEEAGGAESFPEDEALEMMYVIR